MLTARHIPPALQRWPVVQQLATWPRRQWKVAGWSYLAALLIMGVAGETLPGASAGRVVPIQWWNYVTLALSPPLIALIAATFVPPGQPRKARRLAKTGTGVAGNWHPGDGLPGMQSTGHPHLRGSRRAVIPRALPRPHRPALDRAARPYPATAPAHHPDLSARPAERAPARETGLSATRTADGTPGLRRAGRLTGTPAPIMTHSGAGPAVPVPDQPSRSPRAQETRLSQASQPGLGTRTCPAKET